MTLWGATSNLGLIGYESVLVLFLVRDVHVSPGLVGGLIAVTSLGGVTGATAARAIGRRFGTAHGFLLCELVAAPAAPLIALTGPGARLALLVVGGIVVGGGVVAGNVLKASWRQTYTPRALLGRVIASSQLLNYGTIPVGALLAGVLATSLGIHVTLWIMTSVLALSPLILLAAPLRAARELPSAPPALGGG